MKPGTNRYSSLTYLLPCLFLSMMSAAVGYGGQTGFCDKIKACELLSPAAAEKILGQPVRPIQGDSERKGDIRQCRCAYAGISKDQASGKEAVLYFLFEQKENNPSAEQAHQVMETTRNENSHDAEIKELPGIGDEAFLLSDEVSRHLILVRKGAVIIRLQVRQATGKTVLDELKVFAREAARRL